jgi:DNA ligase (NAD+)
MEKFQPSSFDTHQAELKFLQDLGFPTNREIIEANSTEEIWDQAKALEQNATNLSYHIDGMVVKLNDHKLSTDLGVVGKTPRAWCAVKFAAEEVTTKILEVTWQVGRTGKLTPVAELEPVLLVGTIVKRATLHNYKEFTEKGLQPQDTVIIRKAGDIIPEIIQILYNLRSDQPQPQFKPPQVCPVCQTPLALSNTQVDLECPNQLNCRAQVLGRLSYYTQRNIANISGLSEKLIERFVDEFEVQDITDLYHLPYEQIATLEGFGQKSAQNLQESVDTSRKIADYRLLAGLSIEGVGLEVAKLICQKLVDQEITTNQTEAETEESLFG